MYSKGPGAGRHGIHELGTLLIQRHVIRVHALRRCGPIVLEQLLALLMHASVASISCLHQLLALLMHPSVASISCLHQLLALLMHPSVACPPHPSMLLEQLLGMLLEQLLAQAIGASRPFLCLLSTSQHACAAARQGTFRALACEAHGSHIQEPFKHMRAWSGAWWACEGASVGRHRTLFILSYHIISYPADQQILPPVRVRQSVGAVRPCPRVRALASVPCLCMAGL